MFLVEYNTYKLVLPKMLRLNLSNYRDVSMNHSICIFYLDPDLKK